MRYRKTHKEFDYKALKNRICKLFRLQYGAFLATSSANAFCLLLSASSSSNSPVLIARPIHRTAQYQCWIWEFFLLFSFHTCWCVYLVYACVVVHICMRETWMKKAKTNEKDLFAWFCMSVLPSNVNVFGCICADIRTLCMWVKV